MRIICDYGFYKFYLERAESLEFIKNELGLELVPIADGSYTFTKLRDMASYSIKGDVIGVGVATANYSGNQGDILRANGFVYDFENDEIKPISTITSFADLKVDGERFASQTILQVGQFYGTERITCFSGYYDLSSGFLKIDCLEFA